MSDEDGHIDYTRYSYTELVQAKHSIDPVRYPKNYEKLLNALSQFDSVVAEDGNYIDDSSSAENRAKHKFPVGKHGLIEIPLRKAFVMPFRIVMLLLALPFLKELFEIVATGQADLRSFTAIRGEDWGYYAELLKVFMISLFLLWLGTFGTTAKEER